MARARPARASAGWRRSGPTTSTTPSAPTTSPPSSSSAARWGTTCMRHGVCWTPRREVLRDAGRRPRRAPRAGARRGPRQRRPRPPRRVLPRLDGHARLPGHGLRHPLRVRHLRAGDRRRLPGRARRRVAQLRQPLGDRPARSTRCRCASAAASSTHQTPTASSASRWVGGKTVLGVPYDTPIAGYGNEHREHAAAVAGARRARSSTSRLFNDGDYVRAVRGEERLARSSRRSSTRTTTSRPARSCASSRSTSSSPAPSRDIVRRYQKTHNDFDELRRRRSPSSSTTRTRRSRSPS